jgi:hypothetical protein
LKQHSKLRFSNEAVLHVSHMYITYIHIQSIIHIYTYLCIYVYICNVLCAVNLWTCVFIYFRILAAWFCSSMRTSIYIHACARTRARALSLLFFLTHMHTYTYM